MTTVQTLVNMYIQSLVDKGTPAKTISNYRICLEKFCELYGMTNPENLSSRSVIQFEKTLRLKQSKDYRLLILRYLKTLRYFVEWCEGNSIKIGLKSGTLYLRDRRLQKETHQWQRTYHGSYVSRNELFKLNRYWEKDNFTSTLYALRNRAIVAVLGDTGLKVTELINLNRKDYNDSFIIVGKRKISLEQNTRQILNQYLKIRPDKTEPMFVGYSSIEADKIVTQPLGVRSIQRLVKLTGEEVGFDYKISPQTLRNSRLIQALADKKIEREKMKYFFGLSPNNTSYQRYLKIAEQLRETEQI